MFKIWLIFLAVHLCICVIQHPILRLLDYYFVPENDIFDIDYEEFWPFWSINLSILTVYSIAFFIINLLNMKGD